MNSKKQSMQSINNYRFNGIFLLFYLTIILFILTCSGLSREDFLDGEFGAIDTTPPEILAPINDSKVTDIGDTEVALVWTAKIGTSKYTVEIVKDDGSADPFSNSANNIVTGNPFKVTAPDTSVKITLPDAWSYKWRVRGTITEKGKYGESSFHAIDDTIYTFCQDIGADTNCDGKDDNSGVTITQAGNKTYPFVSINNAVMRAKDLELSKVKVAARGNSIPYNETVNLLTGISLYGGYTETFLDASRDISNTVNANITKIKSNMTFTVTAMNIDAAATLEGFTIEGGTLGETYAVYIVNSDNSLTIRNCKILGGDTLNNSFGVYINISGTLPENRPLLELNTIIGGKAEDASNYPASYGIYSYSSSYRAKNNLLISADAATDFSTGIYNSYSNVSLENNIITGGKQTGSGSSYGLQNENSVVTVTNNIIAGGNAPGESSIGIYNDETSGTVTNNTIKSGLGSSTIGIYNRTSSPNNTINVGAAAHSSTGIYNTSASNPNIENNIITASTATQYSYGINTIGSSPRCINNVIHSGLTMNQTCGLRNITGSNAEYYNNTIIVPHAVNISYGITNNESPVITNNIIFSHDHGIHGAIVINTYNYIFTNGQTDYFNNSQGIGDVNQARGVIAPVFVNIPIAYGQTRDGIDADDVYTGDTDTIEVLDCQDGRFVATTEYFEYDKDGIARQITAINCDAGNSFIDFSPALSAPSEEGKSIRLWGTNNTNFVVDYRLSASNSPSLLYGGKNLSGTFITDINGITRTTSNSGQDNDNDSTPNEVTDDGDGWSMSAYEYE